MIGAFKFPTTITSASFVLRKYYLSLLYDFEQVYYFRKQFSPLSTAGTYLGVGFFVFFSPFLVENHVCFSRNLYFCYSLFSDDKLQRMVNESVILDEGE